MYMSQKLAVSYNEGSFGHGEFSIFRTTEVNDYPKDLKSVVEENLAVMVISKKDLKEFNDNCDADYKAGEFNKSVFANDDYRFIINASLDGEYLEITDLCYAYLKKNIKEGVFVLDTCGELSDKWNQMQFKKL